MHQESLPKCDTCAKKFLNKQDLMIHIRQFHKQQNAAAESFEIFGNGNQLANNNFMASDTCRLCNKTFASPNYLKKHVETVHEKRKDYQCNICHRGFTQGSNLKVHIKTIHQKLKLHKCEICKQSFGQPSNLNYHMNKFH